MGDSFEFLIDGILPANEVHLFGGSSGSGKTTFTFQVFLAEWQDGNPIFGHESHPVPYIYVSLDRSRSSVTRTLERLGLADIITRVVCQEEIPEESLTVESVIKDALVAHPDAKLIIIEGFQLLAGEKGNGYTHVGKVLKKAARICSQRQITIIGVCHSPKMKIDEGFQHPRETIMGSASWGAYSDTIITLSLNELTGIISVHVMPRNAKSEKHEMRFGLNGVLESVVKGTKKDSICAKIEALPIGATLMRTEVLAWIKDLGASTRTADDAIAVCLRNKVLDALGVGVYERSDVTPLHAVPQSDIAVEM